jgi:hypothetical protein
LPNLQKLFLAGNKISIFFEAVGRMSGLTDLTTEGNPCEQSLNYIHRIKENFAQLVFFNLKKLSLSFDTKPILEVPASMGVPNEIKQLT